MDEGDFLAERFEAQRTHLRAVAYRMLGSLPEADDAVQEAWVRLSRSDAGGIENLGGWLTTVVARVCLDALRSRKSRREESLGARWPDRIVSQETGIDPAQEALLADSVGLALLVVLETLAPAERLASRARRRVRGAATVPDVVLTRQREVVDAFLAASRGGDFNALLALLDPDVVVRADSTAVPPGAAREARGAPAVAEQALSFARRARFAQPALVNGAVGVVVAPRGRLLQVMVFKIRRGKISEIDVLADLARLGQLDLAVLKD